MRDIETTNIRDFNYGGEIIKIRQSRRLLQSEIYNYFTVSFTYKNIEVLEGFVGEHICIDKELHIICNAINEYGSEYKNHIKLPGTEVELACRKSYKNLFGSK